jgi:AraC-like DNA-binding protein
VPGSDPELLALLERSRILLAEEPLSLEAAAREACISPFHYHRLFSRTYGQTPHEFATERRIDRARRMLLEEDRTVTEVCLDVGYCSLGTFSSKFLRHVGCTPSEFRTGARHFWAVSGWKTYRFVPTCFIGANRKIEEAITSARPLA